jgi:threonine dehydratase
MQQASAAGFTPDQVLIGASGGGLLAGSALAIRALSPATEVHAVEPAAFDDIRRSLAAGRRLENPPEARTICDALMSSPCGAIPFALMQQHVTGGLAVSDDEVLEAMAYASSGSSSWSSSRAARWRSRPCWPAGFRSPGATAILVTGGNVDPATFAAALAR